MSRVANDRTGDALRLLTMERLIQVVQQLSQARDIETIMGIVRIAARELTGADGATFVLRDGDQCHYAEENAISPLWKGRRFPLSACISGWVMVNAKPAVIEDIYADPRIPAEAYRPTFVRSLAMVPIRRNAPIGAIGNYWTTRRRPADSHVEVLQALADTTSVAMENAQLYEELQAKIATLRQRETRIKEQRDAMEVFTRSLAHDLKEPVRTIHSFARLMTGDGNLDAEDGQIIRHIRDAGDRMAMLIETVFLYTQLDDPETVTKERFCLGEAAQAAIDNLSALVSERGAKVSCDPLPFVVANRTHLTQVFQNLISNAVSHSEAPVRVHIGAERIGEMLRICVRDDGTGIAKADQSKIFEPFRRLTHSKVHAGLGLAICRKIVGLHGGTIQCESEAGQGAAFLFTLPDQGGSAAKAENAAPGTPSGMIAPVNGTTLANVLVVDDREADVYLTCKFLSEPLGMRCKFLVARDGKEGLAIIAETLAQGDAIDLVLLDINMPVMDGFEMLERLRADPAMGKIPIVMCTGSTYEKDKQRAIALGAAGYLEKPAQFACLSPIIETLPSVRLVRRDGEVPALVRAE